METQKSKIQIPSSAAWLGSAGAIPFVALASALPFLGAEVKPIASHALLAYGALILSFLGGVHWGAALPQPHGLLLRLGVSVVPSLVAWVALLLPVSSGLWMLAASCVAMLAVDLLAVRDGLLPAWYAKLRVPLTLAVTLCLSLGAWFAA